MIEVNPDALRQAVSADAERASGHRRAAAGLHGVSVLIKDLIATRDRKNTTAGSLALLGSVVSRDAGVVSWLRRAGTVVLGKANLPEWANFRSGRSMGGLHGWSARGGQSRVSTSDCESATTMFFLKKKRSTTMFFKLVVTPTTRCAADTNKCAGPLRALGESVRLEHGLVDSGGSDTGD